MDHLCGLSAGDKLTVRDLIYGMLLPSGNDAAFSAAIHIAGNIEDFADMMNAKARQIGAYNTSFKNPHGLDEDGHFSCAYDLALIMRYALKYDIVNEVINSVYHEVTINNEKVGLKNTNALLRTYEYADGGKTGYTASAERCLICTATKNNVRLIAVVLGAESTDIRFDSTKKILEECFDRYKNCSLADLLNFNVKIPIVKGQDDYYILNISEDIDYLLSDEEFNLLYIKQDFIENLHGDDKKGKYLGRIQVISGNDIIFTKDYILDENINKKSVKKYLYEIFKLYI